VHLVAHSRSAETLPALQVRSLDGGNRLRLEGCQRLGSSWNNGRVLVHHAGPAPRVPCQLTSKPVPVARLAQLAQQLARSPQALAARSRL
jgi:hypothetical protein